MIYVATKNKILWTKYFSYIKDSSLETEELSSITFYPAGARIAAGILLKDGWGYPIVVTIYCSNGSI